MPNKHTIFKQKDYLSFSYLGKVFIWSKLILISSLKTYFFSHRFTVRSLQHITVILVIHFASPLIKRVFKKGDACESSPNTISSCVPLELDFNLKTIILQYDLAKKEKMSKMFFVVMLTFFDIWLKLILSLLYIKVNLSTQFYRQRCYFSLFG